MNYDRPGYLLYQTVHGKPLTVAYISRDDPRTLTERVPVLQHFRHLGPDIIDGAPEQVAATIFADLDVGTVVLDRYKMPGGDERTYTEDLAAAIFAGQDAALRRRAHHRLQGRRCRGAAAVRRAGAGKLGTADRTGRRAGLPRAARRQR